MNTCFHCCPESNSERQNERDANVRSATAFHCWPELVAHMEGSGYLPTLPEGQSAATDAVRAELIAFGYRVWPAPGESDLRRIVDDDAMVIEMLASTLAIATKGGK